MLDAIIEVEGEQVENNEEEIINYFAIKLSTFNAADIQPLDLNYLAAYDKNFGFRYNLECITGIEDKGKIF